MVKEYTLHENHGPSIINRSTFELWRRRIDHKSKILSNVRFEHYTYLHILLDIIFKGFFLYYFQVIQSPYLISGSLCIFRISDKILLRRHSTLKVPYESISILWRCKGRQDRNNEEKSRKNPLTLQLTSSVQTLISFW